MNLAAVRSEVPVSDDTGAAGGGFRVRHVRSQDDLLLYAREYGSRSSRRLPLLCLAGLTRNSRDFHDLALRHAGERLVVAPDYRGRGLSARDPDWRNYRPETYISDVLDLLTVMGIDRVVVVGTSMGGLLSLGLAALRPTMVAGVVLNDIGPDVVHDGYQRILDYIATDRPEQDWPSAIEALRNMMPTLHRTTPEGWQRIAEGSYRRGEDGLLHFDWDTALARGLASRTADLPDLWALYRGLGDRPALVLRGALSDILSEDTFERMAEAKPDLQRAVVPDVGHVPALDEPEATEAIDDFLARF